MPMPDRIADLTIRPWRADDADFVRTLALLVLLGTAMRIPFPWATLDPPATGTHA